MGYKNRVLMTFQPLILIVLLEIAIVVSTGNIPKASKMDSFAIIKYSKFKTKRMLYVPRKIFPNNGSSAGEISRLSEMMNFRGGSTSSSTSSSSSSSIINNNECNKKKEKKKVRKDGDQKILTSQTRSQEGEQQPLLTVKRKKGQVRRTSTRKSPKKRTKTVITKTKNQEAATILRLKREYKDVIQMGIAYDWIRMQSIHAMTSKRDRGRYTNPTYDGSSEHQHQRSVKTTDNSTCYIRLGPLGQNLLLWHFSIQGPPDSAYAEGVYHGRIILPRDYPSSPPRIQLVTPNGRFIPRVDICLSASSYHPETWSPQWTILALIQSLRLHFLTDPNEIGGIAFCTVADKKRLATKSRSWRWRIPSTNVIIDHYTMLTEFQNERLKANTEKSFINSSNFRNATTSRDKNIYLKEETFRVVASENESNKAVLPDNVSLSTVTSAIREDGIPATNTPLATKSKFQKNTPDSSRVLTLSQPKNPPQSQLTKGTSKLGRTKKRNDMLTEVLFRFSFLIGFLLAICLF